MNAGVTLLHPVYVAMLHRIDRVSQLVCVSKSSLNSMARSRGLAHIILADISRVDAYIQPVLLMVTLETSTLNTLWNYSIQL